MLNKCGTLLITKIKKEVQMLKFNQVGAIKRYMADNKKTIIKLAKELEVNRGYLSMVLNGTMSNPSIESKVLKWYNDSKNKKGE